MVERPTVNRKVKGSSPLEVVWLAAVKSSGTHVLEVVNRCSWGVMGACAFEVRADQVRFLARTL